MNDRTIFCDGVSGISIAGGMVRMDLTIISPTQRDPSNRPVVEFRGQVVMPPESFLQAFGLMQKFVQELQSKGAVTATPALSVPPNVKPATPGNK